MVDVRLVGVDVPQVLTSHGRPVDLQPAFMPDVSLACKRVSEGATRRQPGPMKSICLQSFDAIRWVGLKGYEEVIVPVYQSSVQIWNGRG